MKTAFFYDPYLDTVGGGERYVFTLVDYLLKNNWEINVFNGSSELVEKIGKRFDLNLNDVKHLLLPKNLRDRRKLTKNADLFFWLSDGSVPFLFGKNNILHFQVPFRGVKGKTLVNKIKFNRIQHIVCNSEFTKRFIDKEFNINSEVIYPPIDTSSFKAGKKENVILTVGRFSKLLQAKRQDVLIESFKKIVDRGLKGWKFILAGGTDVGGTDFLTELKKSSKGYPIEFFENCSFEKLKELYSKAKIFWYAGGYGIDEEKEPERTEHFGMTAVEAMASGCVPFIVPKGGQKEAIEDKETGFYYNSIEELDKLTLDLINNKKRLEEMSERAILESKKFDTGNFLENFVKII